MRWLCASLSPWFYNLIICNRRRGALRCSIVNVSLGARYDGVNPDASGCVRGGLKVVAALLGLHDEGAIGAAALRGVHVVQINFVDGLSERGKQLINMAFKNNMVEPTEKYAPPLGLRSDLSEK